jgi:hypothetical protein
MGHKIFSILAQHLNIHFALILVRDPANFSEVFDTLQYLVFQDIQQYKTYEFSSALYSDYLTFTVPTGEPYTQFEKMFLTFDKTTCIAATIVGALLICHYYKLQNYYLLTIFLQITRTTRQLGPS